ncbi:MAG: single-stranded DNA-binding protein [Verrucomicrobia bacterium]|nr:single-stranded DNA-binding protein [Verrucomicrobiota bacterium]
MSGYNRVIIMGNLTRDPELKQLPSGTSVADLGLALNETFKNQQGETVERPCFVDVVVWGKQAEACGRYLSKGRCVLVDGRLQYERWEAADGQKRSKLRVRAERVEFIGAAKPQGAAGASGAPVTAEVDNVSENMPF